jgi:hypothetical protein
MALKHPLYGRYAYNLALSIKSADPTQQVCVIADDVGISHLHEGQRMIFDKIIKPSSECYMRDGKTVPLVCKFYLNELTPYEQTLFVDADMIFSPLAKFNEFWEQMQGIEWTMANRGKNDPDKGISEWVNADKLKEAYDDIEQWVDLSSEWICWKKSDLSDSIFVSARQYYDEGKLTTRSFAGDKPDEPFFNLALNKVRHLPHAMPYQPTYWQPAVKRVLGSVEIKKQYYAYSVGGRMMTKQQQNIYEEFCKNASYRMNMPTLKVTHKMNQLPERTVI